MFKPSPVDLPLIYANLNDGYEDMDFEKLEVATRAQSNCREWFEARESRLTASNFGKVLNRKSAPTDQFLKNLFCGKQIKAESLEYGKRHETNAKAKYLQIYNDRHFHECGFVVNKLFKFLGATPDGKLCDNGNSGVVEIKCPFSARNMTIQTACDEITNFYIETIDGKMRLRRDHEYYAQVQGQLMITGSDFCEFIVFTQCDLYTERILPDITFMKDMLDKLCVFFRDFATPFLKSLSTNSSNHTD